MKISIPFLVFFLVISCTEPQEKKVDSPSEEISFINTKLTKWHKDAAETNFESYFNAMTPTSIFIGTDASENWTYNAFKEFSRPYFDRGRAWSFTAVERNIYVSPDKNYAWFDELLDTHMGICRGSGVLSKNNNEWKIEHYVLSLTIPNDNIDEVKALNKQKDSLFLMKLKN